MSFGGRNSWSRQWRERWHQWRRSIANVFVSPWNAIVNACTTTVRAIGQAWNTRHLRYMIQGFPAFFATVGAVVLAINVLNQDRSNLAATYYMEAGRAFAGQQYDKAVTFCEKAIELSNQMPEYRFFLVLALSTDADKKEADKKPEQAFPKRNRAIAIAKTLAPDGRTGHPPAHFWMGDAVTRFMAPSAEQMRLRENHYLRAYTGALERDPKKFAEVIKVSAERLADHYLRTQRWDDAEKYMLRIADEKPMYKVALGQFYKARNRNEDAKRMFDSAMESFRKKLETDVDDHESRLGLAQALIEQSKYDEALKELQKGLTVKPNHAGYTQVIANIFVIKEGELAKQPGASVEERLLLIQDGLAVMPAHQILLGRLYQLSQLQGEEGEKAKKVMQEMLADGKAAPIIHFLLGDRAYKEGKIADAQNHWEQAYKLEPKYGFVANNLAWLMSQQKDVDQKTLESALDMVNSAIKQIGPVPAFCGTRGEIQVKLGKYQEAIPNLNEGIRLAKDNLTLNTALLTAYEKVGNTTMAEIQRKKVDELKAKDVKPMAPDPQAPNSKPAEPGKDAVPSPMVPPADAPATKDDTPAKL